MRECWFQRENFTEQDYVPLAHMECDQRALVGAELCGVHSSVVFGLFSDPPRVRKSRSTGFLWVVDHPGSCRGQGYRKFPRALAEADYQARMMRWRAANRWAEIHSCDECRAADVAGRRLRGVAARACIYNYASMWLKYHTEPRPPEDGS
jgi:hypothetical protein